MDDVISRRVAISLPVKPKEDRYFQTQNLDDAYDYGWSDLQRCIEQLPSAQPEIIRCKDCRNNHWCNIQEAAMAGDNFFCGAAERRTDDKTNKSSSC